MANRHSNPLRRLVLLYLLHLLHRLQELYLPLEHRLGPPEWRVVQGKLGSYRTGGEANDNINTTQKRNVHRKRGTKSDLFLCFYYFSNQGIIFLNKLQLELCYFSYMFPFVCHHRLSAEKVRFMSILMNGWFSGSRLREENGEQTSQTRLWCKVFT